MIPQGQVRYGEGRSGGRVDDYDRQARQLGEHDAGPLGDIGGDPSSMVS